MSDFPAHPLAGPDPPADGRRPASAKAAPGRVKDAESDRGYGDELVAGIVFACEVTARPRSGEQGADCAYERAFAEIRSRLDRSGYAWREVIELTSFHSDVLGQLAEFASVIERHVNPADIAWHTAELSPQKDEAVTKIRVIAARDQAHSIGAMGALAGIS